VVSLCGDGVANAPSPTPSLSLYTLRAVVESIGVCAGLLKNIESPKTFCYSFGKGENHMPPSGKINVIILDDHQKRGDVEFPTIGGALTMRHLSRCLGD
jgi:hypothetical protein